MRLLRLDEVGKGKESFDLHPQVTVLDGLRGKARSRVVQGLAGLAEGQVNGVSGEFEAHGVRFALEPAMLRLLDLRAACNIVLRPSDLPGAAGHGTEALARRTALEGDRDELADRLAEALAEETLLYTAWIEAEEELKAATVGAVESPAGAVESPAGDPVQGSAPGGSASGPGAATEGRLAAARGAVAEAENRLAGAEQAVQMARVALKDRTTTSPISTELSKRRSAAHDAATQAEATLSSARELLDPEAAAAVDAAHAELAVADSLPDSSDSGETPAESDESDAPIGPGQVAALKDRAAEIRKELLPLAEADPVPVAAALGAVSDNRPTGSSCDRTLAAELADQWEEIARRRQQHAAQPNSKPAVKPEESTASEALSGAQERLGAARSQLDSVIASVDPGLSAADVDELELAHQTVLNAQDRSEARFGGNRAKVRLTEARDLEQRVLDRLHFSTYADFVMSASAKMATADQGAVEMARRQVADAEAELATIRSAEPDHAPGGAEPSSAPREPLSDFFAPPADSSQPVAGGDDLGELERQQHQLQIEITRFLGYQPTGDPVAELRVLVAPTADFARLRTELNAVGMAIEQNDFQPDTLVALAKIWLAEQAASEPRRTALTAELVAVEAKLKAVGESAPVDPAPVSSGEAPDCLPAARAGLDEAQQRRAAHEAAEAAVARAQADLDVARTEVESVESEIAVRNDADAVEAEVDRIALADAMAHLEAAQLALGEATEEAARVGQHEDSPAPPAPPAASVDHDPLVDHEKRFEQATEALAAASAEARTLEVELESVTRRLAEVMAAERDQPEQPSVPAMTEELIEEIEWYLLARLAAQREVALAGSLPLVLDDPFQGLPGEDAVRFIQVLERMAGAVQLVVLTSDPIVVEWAESLGSARARVSRGN